MRFVELSYGDWDQHRNLRADHARHARAIDKPIAGLLTDLRTRGLLNDTLVIWGGEFGRTPHAQNGDGRDHNNKGYSIWMAGGGLKPGLSYGQTDEHGYEAVEQPGAHARLARHDPAPAGPGPREADLPLRRPRDAADRRQGKGRQGHHRLRLDRAGRLSLAGGPLARHFDHAWPTRSSRRF